MKLSNIDGRVVLEIPVASEADVKRALLRGVCRRAAKLLRDELKYPGAALALEAYAEGLRSADPIDDSEDETTLVDVPVPGIPTPCYA